MTKKHLKKLAERINFMRHFFTTDDFKMMYAELSTFCGEMNPKFDYTRFERACHGLPHKK